MKLDEESISNLVGKRCVAAAIGEGGVHLDMDDGTTIIFVGILAIYRPAEEILH
jgi:hypothetical protein